MEARNLSARSDVPEPENAGPAPAGERFAVGVERDHEAVVAISLEGDDLAAISHVPDADDIVLAAGREQIRFTRVPGEMQDHRADYSETAISRPSPDSVSKTCTDPLRMVTKARREPSRSNSMDMPMPSLLSHRFSTRPSPRSTNAIDPSFLANGAPPIGVERPALDEASDEVAFGEDRASLFQVPDIEDRDPVGIPDGEEAAIGAEGGPVEAAWSVSGDTDEFAIVGDTAHDDRSIRERHGVALEAAVDGEDMRARAGELDPPTERMSGRAIAAIARLRSSSRSSSPRPADHSTPMARVMASSVPNRWPSRRLCRRASASLVYALIRFRFASSRWTLS